MLQLLDKLESQISGGLCYFTADAKHAQLSDAQATARKLRAALAEQPAQRGESSYQCGDYHCRPCKCSPPAQAEQRGDAVGVVDLDWNGDPRVRWLKLPRTVGENLYTAPPAPVVPEGWRLYSADASIIGKCSVLLTLDPVGTKRWHAMSQEQKDLENGPALFVTGQGVDFHSAFADACRAAMLAAAPEVKP